MMKDMAAKAVIRKGYSDCKILIIQT
jgi:hypothetical protein